MHCSDSHILHHSSAMSSTGSASSASGSAAPPPPPPLPLCYSIMCTYDGIHQCRICPRQAPHPHYMTVRSLHHMCSIEGHEGATIHQECTGPIRYRPLIYSREYTLCMHQHTQHSTYHTGLPRHVTCTATSGGMATASRSSASIAETTTAIHDA